MNYINIRLFLLAAVILSACATYAQKIEADNPPINLIPMYGHPKIKKSEGLKKADEQFIRTVVASKGTRENASKKFAAWGWSNWRKGDAANAMRRFNQSWLLNPNYYQPYWGFGALLMAQGKATEAATHYEKALSLIDEDREKPRLLTDTSRTYTAQGITTTDKVKSRKFFGKANSLLKEALKLDPQYDNAYRAWALSLYVEGNYKKAWDMVKKSRSLGGRNFNPRFIDALSRKMPEPK